MTLLTRYLLTWAMLVTVIPIVVAQDSLKDDTEAGQEMVRQEAAKQFEYFSALAQHFEAKMASGKELKSTGKSIFNWTIGSSWHGSYFVWTCEDRPVLMGCFLGDSENANIRRGFIELHSMTDEPFTPLTFTALRNYEWNPDSKQTKPIKLADTSKPGPSAQLRGRQMRELVDQFAVTMFEEKDKGGGKEQLRLLPKPLYRYPALGEQARDGAIFAFVTSKGTDPEFLLALESDPDGGWLARPMRYCTRQLELQRNNRAIWSVGEYNESGQRVKLTDPYMIVTLIETGTKDFEKIREKTVQSLKK